MFGSRTQLDWDFDPLTAVSRWPADRRVLLLHSGRLHPRWARWSVLAEPIGTYRFVRKDGEVGLSQWLGPRALCPASTFAHRPFADLRAMLPNDEALLIGHIGYDLGRWIERLPTIAKADRDWPIVELGLCPGYLVYDGMTRTWQACGAWRHVKPGAAYPDLSALPPLHGAFVAGEPASVFSRDDYEAAVAACLEYIGAGDVFEVNLAQRFTSEFTGKFPLAHRALFQQLARVSPAWYGAYLELAHDTASREPRRVIASTSPELFLEVDERKHVTTRPIKGTRPASVSAAELRDSAKDTAELNMIVDLMRNDLGRVCDYGSVRVAEARSIESHPTVHHGVATIDGVLHRSKDIIDLLRATLPGGSVTGAPKVRTMQIIDELERVRRGPYCGAIGLISRQFTCLNIAIRTMLIESPVDASAGRVDFSVGGGLVADSNPASEYHETLDKAAALVAALRAGYAVSPSRSH